MQKKEDYKVGIDLAKDKDITVETEYRAIINKVRIPAIKDLSQLKEIPEYKPLDYSGYKYATMIHGVPVVVNDKGQMLIISDTTRKKRDDIIKHIDDLVEQGLVEFRDVDKELHFIDNKVLCDIKKKLKETK